MFFVGFFIGILLTLVTTAIIYIVVYKNQNTIKRVVAKAKYTTTKQLKPKASIIRVKTDFEKAYDEIKNINSHRGGIPDSEINR